MSIAQIEINESAALSTGWQRLKALYNNPSKCMELSLTWSSLKSGFCAGFLVSGILGQRITLDRFEAYSDGKSFGTARNAIRRKLDYSVLMFIKNGLRGGIRLSVFSGFSIFLLTHLATYRNYYSNISTTLIFGVTCSTLLSRGGTTGIVYGFGFGVLPGMVLSGTALAFSWYNNLTVNEGYWLIKKKYEKELVIDLKHNMEISCLMKQEKIFFKYLAEIRLKEIAEQKAKLGIDFLDDVNHDGISENEKVVNGIPITD